MNLRDRIITVVVMVPALAIGVASTPFYRALVPITAVLPPAIGASIDALPGEPNMGVTVVLVAMALLLAISMPRPDFWVGGVVASTIGIMLAPASGLKWVHEIMTNLIGIGRPTGWDMVGIAVPVVAWTLLLFQQQSSNDIRAFTEKGVESRDLWGVRLAQAATASAWTALGLAIALAGRAFVEGVRVGISDVVDSLVMVGAGLLTILGLALLAITNRQRQGPASHHEVHVSLQHVLTNPFITEFVGEGTCKLFVHPDDQVALQRRKAKLRRELEEELNVEFQIEPVLDVGGDSAQASA